MYGDEIAIYFEWMNYFQKWLLIPSAFSVIVFLSIKFFSSIENSPLAGAFSIFMSLWGTVFLVSWRRHCRGLDILWDDYVIQNDAEDLRKEFKGVPCINPVTDRPDTYFPANRRLIEYFKSFFICFPCWCLCCLVIVCFLNATGVIRPHHHGGLFDIASLSVLADAGQIFDPDGNMNMVVSIG
jgi:anoctamin-10